MTRTRWTATRLTSADTEPPGALDRPSSSTLLVSLALGLVAAVLLALGSVVPVVAGARPGFTSAPLLIVLAVLPIALAGLFFLRGRESAAAGVLAGLAALAPGRAVLDLQFVADPSMASRPELYRPEFFALPGAGTGLFLLLAGHVVTVVAGVVAVRGLGPRQEPGAAARGLLPLGLVAAGVAAVGLLMAPFSGSDAFMPIGSAFERPGLVLGGCLLLAFALPVAAGLAISSGNGDLSTGGLLGLGLGALAVSLPALVSGAVVAGIGISAGPIVVLVGIAGLVAVSAFSVEDTVAPEETPALQDEGGRAGEATLPGSPRLRMTAGGLALVTAVAAVAGTFTPHVVVGGLDGPQSPFRWLLLVAGLVVGVLGALLFVPGLAAVVRPALSVLWAGVPLAATAVLTTAITATELGVGLAPGPGVLWTAVAVVAAVATACLSVVAGMVERDDMDDDPAQPGPSMITPLVAGGILAVGAFGTPTIEAPGYSEAAIWSNFGTPSWGLLVALVVVLGACFLAPRSRPARATALLAGATGLAVLRLVEYPLTGGEIPGEHIGVGWWLALACVVALAIAAGLAPRGAIHTDKTRSGSIR